MKKLSSWVGAGCALALLAGCQSASTTSARIQEKSSTYGALPAEQQQKLQQGLVEVGYTADMVYVALGHPTKVSVTTDGKVGIWTYENYYPTEAVSKQPFYAIRPPPRSRQSRVFASGPSSAGAHESTQSFTSAGGSPSSGGKSGAEGSNRAFNNWADPDYEPITLQVLFSHGHVFQLAVKNENS